MKDVGVSLSLINPKVKELPNSLSYQGEGGYPGKKCFKTLHVGVPCGTVKVISLSLHIPAVAERSSVEPPEGGFHGLPSPPRVFVDTRENYLTLRNWR